MMAKGLENVIRFRKSIEITDVRSYQHQIKNLVEFRGFERIVLDFTRVSLSFAEAMVPIVAFCRRMQNDGVKIECVLPREQKLSSLFRNANWAHLIDPSSHKESKTLIARNMPAREFKSLDDQVSTIDDLMRSTLSVLPWLERAHLSAMEWSLNEIVDNVLTHSHSPTGGILQLSLHPKSKDIEFVVADAGIGIPESLRSAAQYSTLSDELTVLQYSLREGVTRGTGQGNGLFGSSQICALSGGRFYVNSGGAYIALTRGGASKQGNCDSKMIGTAVVCTINAATPLLLENSLKMGGQPFQPTDFIDVKYDVDDVSVPFNLTQETRSVGSRAAGMHVRNRIMYLMRQFSGRTIEVDAAGVGVFSSSFADEAFAKLQLEWENGQLPGKYRFRNLSPLNQQLIARSLGQRRITG